MPFITPNAQDSPTFQGQAVVDKTDLTTLANIAQNYGVVTGCLVSPGGGYTVNVAVGTISTQILDTAIAAITGLAPLAASASDRRDIVVASAAGVVSIVSGTPTTETAVPWTNTSIYDPPVKPVIPTNSVLLAEIYIPGGGGTIVSGWITDKTVTNNLSPTPYSSRLIDWGHSWVATPPGPYGEGSIAGGVTNTNSEYGLFLTDGNQWPFALRDALGISGGGSYYRQYQVPAVVAATTTITFLDYMNGDGNIEAVYYVPNGALTGANTNTRQVSFAAQTWLGKATLGQVRFNLSTNMVQGLSKSIMSISDYTGINDTNGAPTNLLPYASSLRGVSGASSMTPQEFYWTSTSIGTGLADPGGTVIIRFGTRYRNYGVSGATMMSSAGPQNGNYMTCLGWGPLPRPNAIEVNVTTLANAGAVSIACSPIAWPIQLGAVVNFSNGQSATLTSVANFGANALAVSAISGAIPAGAQGHVQNGTTTNNEYEVLCPSGVNTWTHGINDINTLPFDTQAWMETMRSVIHRNCAPNYQRPDQANFVYVNGGGTWAAASNPAGGALPSLFNNIASVPVQQWTGTISGSPSVTMTLGPSFEGGIVGLTLLAVAGSNFGVNGTVTVDGGTPPQGAVTFSTSGVSTSGLNVRTVPGTNTATASTAVVGSGTNYTAADVGKIYTGTGTVPAGTVVTVVTDTTHITVSNAITVAGTAATISGYTPMVKRITGLSAGSHTITITLTAKDGANSVLFFYGMGAETVNPSTPVLWCNIARVPNSTVGQRTNTLAYNAAAVTVMNGTATPLAGNTTEPAFGANVQYVDIDSVVAINPKLFADGLHYNSAGNRLMARTLFGVIRNNFTPDQSMSR